MDIAGESGSLDLAFAFQEEMETHGIKPSAATSSALLSACIGANQLDRAFGIYARAVQDGLYPKQRHMNRLITACGIARKMGEIVNLVEDMILAGYTPDVNTYTSIINACQRAGEHEIAFAVAQEMQHQRIEVDEVGTLP